MAALGSVLAPIVKILADIAGGLGGLGGLGGTKIGGTSGLGEIIEIAEMGELGELGGAGGIGGSGAGGIGIGFGLGLGSGLFKAAIDSLNTTDPCTLIAFVNATPGDLPQRIGPIAARTARSVAQEEGATAAMAAALGAGSSLGLATRSKRAAAIGSAAAVAALNAAPESPGPAAAAGASAIASAAVTSSLSAIARTAALASLAAGAGGSEAVACGLRAALAAKTATDCRYGAWEAWGACSVTCKGVGRQKRLHALEEQREGAMPLIREDGTWVGAKPKPPKPEDSGIPGVMFVPPMKPKRAAGGSGQCPKPAALLPLTLAPELARELDAKLATVSFKCASNRTQGRLCNITQVACPGSEPIYAPSVSQT